MRELFTLLQAAGKHLNALTFFAGVFVGGGVVVLFVVVCSYISRFWKPILLLSAVTAAVSLFLLAI